MRCSGKSKIGQELAEILNWGFCDLDREIEQSAGATIPQMVQDFGWDFFRDREFAVCQDFFKKKKVVISPGGGALTFARNWQLVPRESSLVVFLHLPVSVLAERIAEKDDRPSLTGKHFASELQDVWQERKEKYFSRSDLVFAPSPDLPAQENAQALLDKIEDFCQDRAP